MNQTLAQIIHLLSDGKRHSGSELGETLGITRSAVWKLIPQIPNYGVDVLSTQGKGYQLAEPMILLNQKAIWDGIENKYQQRITSFDVHQSITTTNEYVNHQALSEEQPFHFCIAEHLSKARGRLGRTWHAPYGQNIYLSGAWIVSKDISELSGLSLVVGLAFVKALQTYGLEADIKLKWPNDLIYKGEKVGGVLVESTAEIHGQTKMTIAIGLNVNMLREQHDDNINQAWASLRLIEQRYHDRNQIVPALINSLIDYLDHFKQVGFEPFIESWMSYDYFRKQQVKVINAKQTIYGTAVGINQQGNLLLQHKDGTIHAYSAGDVSLRKADVLVSQP